MEKSSVQLCSKCVTPASYPRISFDATGVCSHCREFERRYRDWQKSQTERTRRLEGLIAWAKRKRRPYDALVPLSGGKDSTYVLYLATKRYQLRTLAFTFDNGFQSDIARKNICEAINRSGADHIVVRPSATLLGALYRHFMEHTGLFCPVCMRGIYAATFALTRQFRVPLVLKGTSARTEERVTPEIFQDGRLSFFKQVLARHPFEQSCGLFDCDRSFLQKLRHGLFLLFGQRVRFGTVEIQVPDFLDWNYDEIYKTISSEMGWRSLPDRDEHVDCLVEPVAQYLRKVRVPDLTPSMLRYSAEIRVGQRERRAALEQIGRERLRPGLPQELPIFLERLGVSEEWFRAQLKDPFRHMQFQKEDLARRLLYRLRPAQVR